MESMQQQVMARLQPPLTQRVGVRALAAPPHEMVAHTVALVAPHLLQVVVVEARPVANVRLVHANPLLPQWFVAIEVNMDRANAAY